MCENKADRRKIDKKRIFDDGYLDQKKVNWSESDLLNGGRWQDRDNWFEFSSRKHKKFRNWCHREIIEKMSDEERQQPASRATIQQWYRDCPDKYKPRE